MKPPAARMAEEALQGYDGPVIVAPGDTPLIDASVFERLLEVHGEQVATVTVATCSVADPTAYGRLIRDPDGRPIAIVEEKDATDEERAVREVNAGVYCFEARTLFRVLPPTDRRELGLLYDIRRAVERLPLLSRGKTSEALYVVVSGELAVELPTGERRVARAGTLVGERSVLRRGPSDVAARAVGSALVLHLDAARLARFSLVRFVEFASTPGMGRAVWNTIWVALVVTVITVPLAFLYAYAIQRACLPLRGVWRVVGLSALLGPSLVGAISFIQWFGTQGVLKSWLGDNSVYGPIGIIISTVYASFPHALMILVVALATADARLFEAAEALSASRWRKFVTVTLPSARYGLISAALVVFSYSVSEFGIPRRALETVGYGEEFLLVQRQDENWRNRRVTLRRITDQIMPF